MAATLGLGCSHSAAASGCKGFAVQAVGRGCTLVNYPRPTLEQQRQLPSLQASSSAIYGGLSGQQPLRWSTSERPQEQKARRRGVVVNAVSDDSCGAEKREEDDDSVATGIGDWREFRAKLIRGFDNGEDANSDSSEGASSGSPGVATATGERRKMRKSWAHPLVKPETGCLVIAHPAAFGTSQQYFHQAVIFLFAHSDEGSAGIILNRPTEFTLGQVAGFEELMPEFQECPLYIGGDVGAKSTHVLHGHGDLDGVKEIISGVYVGGYSSLKDHVRRGQSSALDYRWFARYSGWGPGQLEREVAAGVWYLGSCSADLILKHSLDPPVPLWKETMELMGGEYAKLARRTFGEV